MEILN